MSKCLNCSRPRNLWKAFRCETCGAYSPYALAIHERDEARAVARLWRTVALEEATDIRTASLMDLSETLDWLVAPLKAHDSTSPDG